MRIEDSTKLDYSDVLLRPKRSRLLSRKEVAITRAFKFPHAPLTWAGVPIMASNMDSIGTFEVARILAKYDMLTCIHKHYSLDEWKINGNDPYVIISQGIKEADWDKTSRITSYLHSRGLDLPFFLCLDVANGYSQPFARAVEDARNSYSDFVIIAGNVATPEMTEELILRGADIVKVGIGPGSACTTRKMTGVGYPQLSAVMECSDAAHGLNGHIIADGGCTCPGDVAKAFCAGADFVMLGGLLAGTDETGTQFYGMSSDTAMKKYNGGTADYRASEGKTVDVPLKGPLEDVVKEILGGVRSAATYIGAESIKNMPKCSTFIRVVQQKQELFR
jgi:GMP reductase